MNTCPVYRRSGGYSYSYFIPGPVGTNLGMLRSPKEHSGNLSACTLCASCQSVCPVKIDLADQIYRWRQQLGDFGTYSKSKKALSDAMSLVYNHLYNPAVAVSPVLNLVPETLVPFRLRFPRKPFHSIIKDLENE
jgi:L-lactate dehydrogenase complex protein LldF